MRRDKKAAQKKKNRDAKRKAMTSSSASSLSGSAIGPAFMSGGWREASLPPKLVTVLVTRTLANGRYLAHSMLIDRTCLGVKNAFTVGPVTQMELAEILARIEGAHPEGVDQVDFHLAQAVVFHALDYAKTLGFEPNEDFDPKMLAPRPSTLQDTPFAKPERPFFVPGPHDDADAILEQLEEAVGADGFDCGDDLEDEEEHEPDEEALNAAFEAWGALIDDDPRLDHSGGFDAFVHAVTGAPLDPAKPLDPAHITSLPFIWGTMFRPLPGGQTGLELARATPEMADHAEALARVARTRATLVEVLEIDPVEDVALCRDVFDGTKIEVRISPSLAKTLTRWTRLFGYFTPMEDDSWYPPATLLGHALLRDVEPKAAIARLNELLATLGIDERVDPANPSAGLTRFGALMDGVLQRSIAPTPEQLAEDEAPIYLVNADDERIELHGAALETDEGFAELLASADDFVAEEGGFAWTVGGTAIAHVLPTTKTVFDLNANSAPRFERLMARLSELVGKKLVAQELSVMRPWEVHERAVGEEVPGARKLVMGAGAELDDLASMMVANVRRTLDTEVPALGGRPRALVEDAAGRARVEDWLVTQELRGNPGGGGVAFVNLDEIRDELKLPTVHDA